MKRKKVKVKSGERTRIRVQVDEVTVAHIEINPIATGGINLSIYERKDDGRNFIKWVPNIHRKDEEE